MEESYLEHPNLDGRIILKWIFDKGNWWGGGIDWINLALVNSVMNFRGSIKSEKFLQCLRTS